jgi:predicted kinase
MIARLAEKRKELALNATSSTPKSDQEKIELRKKFKEKVIKHFIYTNQSILISLI